MTTFFSPNERFTKWQMAVMWETSHCLYQVYNQKIVYYGSLAAFIILTSDSAWATLDTLASSPPNQFPEQRFAHQLSWNLCFRTGCQTPPPIQHRDLDSPGSEQQIITNLMETGLSVVRWGVRGSEKWRHLSHTLMWVLSERQSCPPARFITLILEYI